jgi:two-component system sensor histidine kinase KdpD
LLVILIIAAEWGLMEAVIASMGAVFCFNYFFLPPMGTLTIADPQNWVALTAFLLTAVISSHLSTRVKRKSIEANQRSIEMEQLYSLSRALMIMEGKERVARQIADQIVRVFSLDSAAVLDRLTGEISYSGPKDFPLPQGKLQDVALQGTLFQDPGSQVAVVPLRLGGQPVGSLGLWGRVLPDSALYAVANLAAIAFERARNLELVSQAEAARRSQELKSTLLDAIAHEFKTPLTSIKGAVTGLLCPPPADPAATELLTVIDVEADRIDFLITETIEMARLEAEEIQVRRELCAVSDLVRDALRRLRSQLENRPLSIDLPSSLPPCWGDPALIRLVISHLVSNAIKYCPPGSPIRISAVSDEGALSLSVRDQGPGIPENQLEKIFEKYYRLPSMRDQVAGTGVGLTISRKIVEAHGGRLWATSQEGKGSTFQFSLPSFKESDAK